jgi:hypothetical protein
VSVVFENLNGRLLHSRLFGDARLFLRVSLEKDGEERARLEWNGTRDQDDAMQVTMAATGLDLSTLSTYLRGAWPEASLRGTLDGVADFTTPEPGVGQLDLDLVAHSFETGIASDAEPLQLPNLSLRVRVDLDHDRVVLSKGRIGTGELDFTLDARIARPLGNASRAEVTVSLAELEMAPESARKLAGWLPAAGRERFTTLAGKVRSGKLVSAKLRGVAPIRRWRELLAGELAHLPAGFRFALEVDDVAIDVDEANRLEHLSADLVVENDKLEVHRATGDLNGGPLPVIEVSFQGLSKLLDAPERERGMVSSAEALVGLTPLFEFLRGDADDGPTTEPPSVALTFEHLYHPALLWPMHDVRVQLSLERDTDGVLMQIERCAWAGVFLDGEVDWTLHPTRRIRVDLVASGEAPEGDSSEAAAPATPTVALASDQPGEGARPWVTGRFEVGEIMSPGWGQRGATGRFSAAGGELRLEDVAIELEPHGLLIASVDLDLTLPGEVPYAMRLSLDRADLATLIRQRGAEREFITGSLGVKARFTGSLVPGVFLLHDADGEVELRASKGAIQRSVPPVLALALASSSLNPFSRREELQYEQASAHFDLEQGTLRTQDLEIEGPDIRLFATGTLDLSESPRPVDAEVALFLFRQIDRALELIPILNVLLLGENDNLVAAYFHLGGTWEEPVATSKPLRTLGEGPGDVLTKGIPRIMMRGVKAIGGLFGGSEVPESNGESDAEKSPAERTDS